MATKKNITIILFYFHSLSSTAYIGLNRKFRKLKVKLKIKFLINVKLIEININNFVENNINHCKWEHISEDK